MMKTQRDNEMQWYTERQSLKRTQSNRAASTAAAHSILASLGTSFAKPASDTSPQVDKDAELLEFDRKVYAAQQSMEAGLTTELKGLGVPFFGVREDVVVKDGGAVVRSGGNGEDMNGSGKVTEEELRNLRRRMVGHLEDLYRD
jgi:hypothetical protein